MKTTFTRECNFYIDYSDQIIKLDTISSLDFETRYTELTKSRKTLHNKTAFEFAKGDLQDITSISMVLYITDSFKESIIFELLGWGNEGSNLTWDGIYSSIPNVFKLVVEDPINKKFYIFHSCVILDLSLPWEKNIPGKLNLTIDSALFEVADYFAIPYYKSEGANYLKYTAITLQADSTIFNIQTAMLTITNEYSWHSNKNMFNKSSGLFFNKNPICTNRSLSLTSSIYLNHDSPLVLEPYYGNIILLQGGLGLYIDNALIMTRLSNDDTFLISLDIKPSHKTNNVSLSFDY